MTRSVADKQKNELDDTGTAAPAVTRFSRLD
ncbi:uncharacterized protein FFNC_07158 [Fusarium fujikuroi]|nr:uncharacterized protein FFC1_11921 [Fusarium fujikuroi]SCO15743.1 uncharacterized protein FFE2_13428 [Fusarium fujikuroi]SCO22887.1 uncharacterized protein FFM5_13136 [Fusarium fujikuroi]SCO39872.1 uncharacterized protein FFNC_07158 [Fusarium fujikuroi]SCV38601.1 uncharacterized protein FFB14_06964 [Fusarium fujikuroi]